MSFSTDLDKYLTTPEWGARQAFVEPEESTDADPVIEDWLGNLIQDEDEIFEISFYEYKSGQRWKEYRIATAKSFREAKGDLATFEVEYLGNGEQYKEGTALN